MSFLRFKIAGLMVAVILVAILLAVFRLYSVMGLVALSPVGLTMLIGRLGSSPSRYHGALWCGAIGTLVVPFLAAIWINKAMWGYFVDRPVVDRRIVETICIDTITSVKSVRDASGNCTFAGASIGDVDSYIQVHPQEGDYYILEGRVLRALKHRQMLPAKNRVIPANRLERLYQFLYVTDLLEDGETGYPNAKELRGIVVEAHARDGRPLLFIGVRGREISNDHYPYYEFLFTSDSLGGPLKLLSSQRFYYDVAGIEGVEWPVFFLILAFLGLIPTLPVQAFLLKKSKASSLNGGFKN